MAVAALAAAVGAARAQREPGLDPEIHGFVSEGGFVSTDNDYIGDSSKGSLALFEAALNVSIEPADRLRVGVQLFSRKVGELENEPRIDWAFLDYAWRPWLGLRAGKVKMPFGLYNEFADVDSARLPILLPHGIYPVRSRDVILAHTGLALYGAQELGCGGFGELEYQAWLGQLSVPRDALELNGGELLDADPRYVTGAQVFWRPPLDGLKLGATVARASVDFDVRLDAATVTLLKNLGLVPMDYDGRLLIAQRPTQLGIASAEYTNGTWAVAGEYVRQWTRQVTDLPAVAPEAHLENEAFYAMASYRPSEPVEVGGYYSVEHPDVHDRLGREGVAEMRLAKRWHGFQRDAAVTIRYDVNDHWLWKLEAHFIDGVSSLPLVNKASATRYWGLFLFKTTVTF